MKIEKNILLASLTTWKIGGRAKFFAVASTVSDVKEGLDYAKKNNLEYFILGGGSNILVSDSGFEGLVIKIEINGVNFSGDYLTAGAGTAMSRLAALSIQENLTGLEWAVGIPGTVGGAVFGNSNCFGGSTGQNIRSVKLLDKGGNIRIVDKSYFEFDYDFSKLQDTSEIALEVTFALEKAAPETIEKRRTVISKTAAERVSAQPLGKKVAGSVFKALKQNTVLTENIDKFCPTWKEEGIRDGLISAGFIIDKCLNLRGYKLEKMKISELHANFFENLGGATAKNAKKLIDFIKKECKNKLNIDMEEEIKYVGKF